MRTVFRSIIALCYWLVSTQTATAQNVTYSNLYNNSSFGRSIDLARPVGVIDGSVAVTPSGAASYTIPIKCPPGTNGMIPELSLVYNSQSGNGVLGMGWSLSGLSVITRAGKDPYHDNTAAAVSYTNADAFVLDGQRLAVTGGSNGSSGSTYRTESESYSVVSSNGSYGSGGGPEWFKVVTKDGTIMEYGHTTDSRTATNDASAVMIWRLNRIQDAFGNFMTFRYTNNNNGSDPIGFGNLGRDCQLAEILYTGNVNTGLTPYNKITFLYAKRGDPNMMFKNGSFIESRYVLTGININGEDGVGFKSYALSYANEDAAFTTAQTYLKSVEEFSYANSLNTTIFKYGDQPVEFTVEATNIPVAVNNTNSIYAGDYTGDGIGDILKQTDFGTTYTIYKKDGGSYMTHGSPVTMTGSSLAYTGRGYYTATLNRGFMSSDYNGDNTDDILGINIESRLIPIPGSTSAAWIDFYAGTTIKYPVDGTTTTTDQTIGVASGMPTLFKDKLLIPGDFDGDQRMDYFNVLNSYSPSGSDYYVAVTFPKKGDENKVIVGAATGTIDRTTAFKIAAADQVYVVDYDGDGKSEVMITDDSYYRIYSFRKLSSGEYALDEVGSGGYPTGAYHKILGLGDFNDDGITDLITRQKVSPYGVAIGYGTGKGFAEAAFSFQRSYDEICSWDPGPGTVTAKGDDIYVADFNGDGKADIFHMKRNCNSVQYANSANFDIYYSVGMGFKYKTYGYNKRVAEEVKPCIGDFNGDGKADLAFMIRDDAVTDPKVQILFFRKDGQERLLQKVTDGFNRTTQLSYETIARGKGVFYEKGSGATYPVNNVQMPSYVVTGMFQPDGVGGMDTTWYGYVNQLWHRGGKGFLGFERTKSLHVRSDVHTESVYGLYEPLQLPYLKEVKTMLLASTTELSHSTYQYKFNNSGWLYAQQCTSSVIVELMKGKGATEETKTYDAWGNVTTNVTKVSAIDIESETTTTTTSYAATGAAIIPNKPVSISITRKRGLRTPVTKPVTITYKPNGLVWQHKEFPSSMDASYTEYDYDAYGNKTYEAQKTNNLSSPYTPFSPENRYTYDSKGRFVTINTNPLGQISKTSWHPLWGKPIREESVSGEVTTYEYDLWGKLTKTTYPGPYEVTNTEAWSSSPGILYTSWQQHPGAPDEKKYYDLLGRVVKTETEAFGGAWARVLTTYNNKGKVVSTTNKHLTSETPLTTTNTYDVYGNVKTSTNAFGTTTYDYVYDRGIVTVAVTNPAVQTKVTKTDAIGRVLECGDNGGPVKFSYDSWGNQTMATNGRNVYLSREYNAMGQLTLLNDQDAGRTTYAYNPFGKQTTETDAEGNTTTLSFLDKLGRLTQKVTGGYTTTYKYHGYTKENNLAEAKTTGPDGVIIDSTDYNSKGQLIREKRIIPGNIMEKKYGYDIYGHLSTTDYSSGLRLKQYYDANGILQQVKTNFAGGGPSERTLYNAVTRNGLGQPTYFIRDNGEGSAVTYYHGIPTRYYSLGFQDLNMTYDYTTGNLVQRRDASLGITEDFTYDNLNRLTSSVVSGPGGPKPPINISYDNPSWGSRGNIMTKTDAGDYRYSANKVVEITNPAPAISHELQTITYTPFRRASMIREPRAVGGPMQEQKYTYNGNEERVYSQYTEAGTMKEQRWYFGDLERQLIAGSPDRFIHYIPGGGNLGTIVVTEGGAHTFYTVYTDHLGSIVKITDETGTEVASLNYNAWGRERKAASWDYPAPGVSAGVRPSWLYRGYTGHEMLPQFGLIDMNGRMYDPVNGRMLRPDNYVQDPMSSQNYNRYSYCLNNPLKYIDPSGQQYVGTDNGAVSGFSNGYSSSGYYNGIPYAFSYNHSYYVYTNSLTTSENNGFTTTTYYKWITTTEEKTAVSASAGPWSMSYSQTVTSTSSSSYSTTSVNPGWVQRDLEDSQRWFMSAPQVQSPESGNSWLSDIGKANSYAGFAFTGLEYTPGSFRLSSSAQGFSPRYYGNGWGGNQYAKTFNIGKIGKGLGQASTALSLIVDWGGVISYAQNPNSPNAVHPGKATLNTGVAAYSAWVNPVFGVMYSTVDAFYPGGWGNGYDSGFLYDQKMVQFELDRISSAGPNHIRLVPLGAK